MFTFNEYAVWVFGLKIQINANRLMWFAKPDCLMKTKKCHSPGFNNEMIQLV